MTDPALRNPSKPIKLTITSAVLGQPLTVINKTNGERLRLTIPKNGQAVVDLQNLESGYTSGDIIDFMVSGEQLGSASLTTSGDAPESVSITVSAITSGLIRGI